MNAETANVRYMIDEVSAAIAFYTEHRTLEFDLHGTVRDDEGQSTRVTSPMLRTASSPPGSPNDHE